MEDLRFAVFGAGFWTQYQLHGWQEAGGARPVAIYNRTRAKAQELADRFSIPAVYDDPQALLAREALDFVDIITAPSTHRPFVELVAEHGLPVICQKPMAETYEDSVAMVRACRQAGVTYMIHENWRWQRPLRELKRVLDEGSAGRPFRARIDYCNSFPVFENQPFLKELEQFILTDIGSHILDVARFLFGEASTLYCQTSRVHPEIRGEDVATVVMAMEGVTVTVNMSYASRCEHDRFPETYVFVECDGGAVELGPDYWLRTTSAAGTMARRVPPPRYPWADPEYGLIHASIVPTNADCLQAMRSGEPGATAGADNLRTMQLVFASYRSAAEDRVLTLAEPEVNPS